MKRGYTGKHGHHIYCTFMKWPKYMENPLQFVKRKPPPDNPQAPFKNGHPRSDKTWKPSPSVSTNKRNLFRRSSVK